MKKRIRELTLGFSPCPNDTAIFHGLVHNLVDTGGFVFRERLEDVQTLNKMALRGGLDVVKVSFHAFGHLRKDYFCLGSGAALGWGCGPLIVSRQDGPEFPRKIAIPGGLTTANLLLLLYNPALRESAKMKEMIFSDIMPAVSEGRADWGVIIHEGRFTYRRHGLKRVQDLGKWWEKETGLPIPLGCIAAKRSLGKASVLRIERALRESVLLGLREPAKCRDYIKMHAQEMESSVIRKHIGLYVNEDTIKLSGEGEKAISLLMKKGEQAGLFPPCRARLFAE
ncbi:MAG: 1,4-dihydroxy-6-naphthoate synthase [Actinomycetota bacterium]|nr:1,4-dihydroxy-6-naphthoate synthase [Actinomycetota bacterium]